MKRIFRRRAADESPRAGVTSLFRGRARGERLPGYRRLPSSGLARLRGWVPWGAPPPVAPDDPTQETDVVAAPVATAPSFKDRSRLRRRLRFLRRTRELGFRDVGGLIFDMRRFSRNRPDLLDAKLDALLSVDQELRSLERILDDRRPIHELHEPGISACQRCGALHASEANFCPECGLQISGPRAMGELGGTIAAPPKPPPVLAEQDWAWPFAPPADQPTAQTVTQPEPASEPDQPTTAYVPALSQDEPKRPPPARDRSADEPRADEPKRPPPVRDLSADEPREYSPARDRAHDEPAQPPAKPKAEPKRRTAKPKAEPAQPPAEPKAEPKRRTAKRQSAPASDPADDGTAPDKAPTETKLPPQPSDGS